MNWVFKSRFFFLFMIIGLYYLYIKINYRIQKVEKILEKEIKRSFSLEINSSSLPIVLQWNDIHWVDILPKNLKCEKQCFFTKTMRYESNADVILFYFGNGAFKEIPKSDQSKRINAMITFEPPTFGNYFSNMRKDFFNYTVTYRSDSDLPMPYDCLKELEKNDTDKWSDDEVNEAVESKSNTALYLVSHCSTHSKRESVIEKIKNYLNVTQFGECNNNQCPRDEECEKNAIKSHYFYFAFENSVCFDYISEKLFRFRQLIVPIILDRSVLRGENAKLNPYVIAVSDFKSVKDLVEYLELLMNNKEKYLKYFEWTKLYKKTNRACLILENIGCKMCDLAWQVKGGYQKVIPDIQKWYADKQCRSDFGKYIQ